MCYILEFAHVIIIIRVLPLVRNMSEGNILYHEKYLTEIVAFS